MTRAAVTEADSHGVCEDAEGQRGTGQEVMLERGAGPSSRKATSTGPRT